MCLKHSFKQIQIRYRRDDDTLQRIVGTLSVISDGFYDHPKSYFHMSMSLFSHFPDYCTYSSRQRRIQILETRLQIQTLVAIVHQILCWAILCCTMPNVDSLQILHQSGRGHPDIDLCNVNIKHITIVAKGKTLRIRVRV